MNKINFQNGITPLNDTNLNQLQDNMEEAGVVVSPTQPTTNEKVWIQKGKNLFNKNGLVLYNSRLDAGNSSVYTQADCFTSDYMEVLPDKPYSLQGINAYHLYNESKEKITQNFFNGNINEIITTNSNAKYIRISTWDINIAMVSQSSTTTDYEPYIEKKIYVEGEEFLDVEKARNSAQLETTPQTPNGNTKITYMQLLYDNGFVLYLKAITDGVEHSFKVNLTQID